MAVQQYKYAAPQLSRQSSPDHPTVNTSWWCWGRQTIRRTRGRPSPPSLTVSLKRRFKQRSQSLAGKLWTFPRQRKSDGQDLHCCQHSRLQQLLPSLCIKENVTQLDIILEAIRYIDSLTHKLARFNSRVVEEGI